MSNPPQSILILGAGAFGLSTTLSLLHNPTYKSTHITILDASATLPNPSGSSVDANRVVRADYADKEYSTLAMQAQQLWRDKSAHAWGGEGRYHEPGFILTADGDRAAHLQKYQEMVRSLAQTGEEWSADVSKIRGLSGKAEIREATGYEGGSGESGYANFNSGWADAEACVAYALKRVRAEGGDRVTIRANTKVQKLLVRNGKCSGAVLENDEEVVAELTILATGAWSPTLIDLQGRCLATGQTMAFIDISDEEQAQLESRPTVMNWSHGMFIIPPRKNTLKIARHGYGYRNPVKVPRSQIQPGQDFEGEVEVSVPTVGKEIPLEAQQALRAALRAMTPRLGDRIWSRTRICWYCDTPTGDFLITHHPTIKSLFLATGGSGHGFKFFPVIGDKIVAAIEGSLRPELAHKWRWRDAEELNEVTRKAGNGDEFIACEDGSRAGAKGMILSEEMARTE